MRTVHLMRHGEVDNPAGVLYGRLPGYHLSGLGQEMTAMTARYLYNTGARIRTIYASPLERAQESAQPAAELYRVKIRTDERLIEAGNAFEGQAVNANRLSLAHPRNWLLYRNPFTPSWGEPYTEIVNRMTGAIRSALNSHPNGDILIVSHQLPIWCTRLFLERRTLAHDPRRRECALASLTSLHFDGTTLRGISYSEPAEILVNKAKDMVPGNSDAALAGTDPRP